LGNDFVALIEPRFGTRVILRSDTFGVSIGKGCGGMDAFFLFSYCYFLWVSLAPKLFSKFQWVGIAFGGLFLMVVLNTVRISLFFLFSFYAHHSAGESASSDLFLTLFHTNSGWVLYLAGIGGYFLFCEKNLNREKVPTSVSEPTPRLRCSPLRTILD
jgi:exosortase/archaeosortase family protein